MEKELRSNLLILAEAYAGAMGIALSTLARQAAGDWRFFQHLEEDGKTFTARKYDEVVQWFSDSWPSNVQWPEGVVRPEKTPHPEQAGAA
ncbi:MAG: hypothetical protein WC807_14675 [Hyphomicrobium sp.]|jgi:hypothetical protein